MDVDPRFLAESVLTMHGDKLSPLILWVNFFIMMMRYCVAAAIIFPNHLYYTMFMGQVAPKEINYVQFDFPKTQAERDDFKFEECRDAVKALYTPT